MLSKRLLKAGVAVVGASLGVYYNQEIHDGSVGVWRFGKTAIAVGEIMIDYKKSLYSNKLDRASQEYANTKSEVHLRSAQRLLKLCENLGGAYIKVGQHLGALDYLIPYEYVSTMRVLQNQAPESSFEEILSVIKEDLQCDPSTVFRTIEKKPLGTASLAQVHKAELNDGTIVAVKVQHTLVKTYSTIDIKSMEVLVNFASWVFPDLKLEWLVRESKKTLPLELNFVLEGKNAEKTARLMKHLPWLHVPKVFWEFSTSRVLTMEYCDGFEIAALEKEKKGEFEPFRKEISRKITQLYSDMIFLHGYVHCDPHHGNLKIELDKQGRLVIHLLDHGLYTQLPFEFRENYAKFWMSIIYANVKGMQEYSEKLGVKELYAYFACMVSGRSMSAVLGRKVNNTKTDEEEVQIKVDAAKYLSEIMEVLHQVPSEMLFILKTNDLLRGLNSTLGVKDNINSFATMSRSCANASYLKEYPQCKSLSHKLCVIMSHYVAHVRITTYQLLLWWASWWRLL